MDTVTSSIELEQWRKKRHCTYISYLLQSLLDGLQTSLIAASLWIYLKTVPGFKDKKLLYGLICGAFNLNTILFGVVISRWTDKTRKAKQMLIACTFVSLIGSVLYMNPSPYYILVGRFLNGFIPTARPILTSEISRSYPNDELQQRLPLLSFFSLVGYALGPVMALSFTTVHIQIGASHLSSGNLCALVLVILTPVQLIVLLCFAHNLSEEYDLKANAIEQEVEEISNPNRVESSITVIKKLLCNVDTLLALVMTFMAYLWTMMFYWCIPSLIVDIMGYGQHITQVYYITNALLVALSLLVVAKMNYSNKRVFWIGISTFISFLVVGICIITVYNSSAYVVKIICLCIHCLGLAYLELGEKVFLVVSFAKMLRSKNQGIGESFRTTLKRAGGLVGSSTALYVMQYFNYTFCVLAITITVIIFCLAWRRKSFYNPQADV